jgi:membrane protein involved in colicin uptake
MTTSIEPVVLPQTPSVPVSTATPQAAQYFTAEQVEAVRQQEKDKLYSRIQNTDTQLAEFKSVVDQLKADKEVRDAELETQRKAAEDANKKAAESKLTAEQLVAKRETELASQQEKFQKDMDFKLAVMAKEQELSRIASYAQRRVSEEIAANNIIPELVKYINGETESDIEAAIATAKEDTAKIVQGVSQLTNPVIPGGVSPTSGPSGPLDTLSGPRQVTPEEIAAMNQTQYRAWREKSGMARSGQGQGLFN